MAKSKGYVAETRVWEIAPPKETQGRKTGTQGQAQGQHAPRGQVHVGCPFLLTCAKIRRSLRDFARISQVRSVGDASFCFEGQTEKRSRIVPLHID